MKKIRDIIFIVILILLLFLIRAFENDLFYDPLIVYFQNDYLYTSIPEIKLSRLFVDILFRYVLNFLISIGILWILFKKKSYLKFAVKFYSYAFLFLSIILLFFVITKFRDGYLFPFYVRRFLIHPLFLFLLIPAFYYQKRFR